MEGGREGRSEGGRDGRLEEGREGVGRQEEDGREGEKERQRKKRREVCEFAKYVHEGPFYIWGRICKMFQNADLIIPH